MTTYVITEAEFQRRVSHLTRDEQTAESDAEARERFVKALRNAKGRTVSALRAISRSKSWLDEQLRRDSRFRESVVGLIPSRRMAPTPTAFGRWLMQCPRVRERVAFAGDVPVPDIIAVAAVASAKYHFPGPVPEVDVIVAGIGADVRSLVGFLARGGIILGIGVGPQGIGAVEIVSTPEGRFFRMSR